MSLLLALALQGEADAALTALRERFETSKGLRIEFEARGGQFQFGSFSGKLLLKGERNWALEIEGGDEQGVWLHDGKRTVQRGGRPAAFDADTAARIRRSVAVMPAVFALRLAVIMRADGKYTLPTPSGAAKELAREMVDGRECRVLEYSMRSLFFGGQPATCTTWLDAKTLLPAKRRLNFAGQAIEETLRVVEADVDLPDSAFVFASRPRLAAARAVQLAKSVDLFTRYGGRRPTSLREMAEKPADFRGHWPDGSFVLGGAVFADPWGRPFELGEKSVVSRGADGKSGGSGDDADVEAPLAPASGRAIAAPSARLRERFTAAVNLQLVAAALRACADGLGDLPAELGAKLDGIEVWPEGGFVPGGKPPEGIEVVLKGGARIAARSPKLKLEALTPEERAGLEAASLPAPSAAQKAELDRLVGRLSSDSPVDRDGAESELRRLGPAVAALLDERIRSAQDAETSARLRRVRAALEPGPAEWRGELGRSVAWVGAGAAGAFGTGERNASASLKTLASAEADFRANDRDGNRIQDFWVGDVAGLYALKENGGEAMKLIEARVAAADAAPLEKDGAEGRHLGVGIAGEPGPRDGYFFQAMTHDASEGKPEPYASDTQGAFPMGKTLNHSRFGYCAFPAEYGGTGLKTYIINEGNTVFWKDSGGEPVLTWPTDAELRRDWKKLD